MKNFFDIKALKSSEDCDKFSKSVSYETLVGGTTTIGRGRKQTQRLCEYCANKPLTAVGTLTSLLCNSAKVMEKLLRYVITRRTSVRRGYLPEQGTHASKESLFASVTCFMRLPRRIQRMLLVMTIPALALIFTLITTAESRAETCKISKTEFTCRSGIDSLGKTETGEYICGTDCTFTIDGDTIKVKANSKNATIDAGIFSPKAYSDGKVVTTSGREITVDKIELDGDFASIGKFAFAYSAATIVPKSGTLRLPSNSVEMALYGTIQGDVYVEEAVGQSLHGADIKGNLIFADGIKTIADWFMGRATIDGDVIIPASVTSINSDNWITLLDSLNEGHKVYCGAGNCYQLFYDSCYKDKRGGPLSECLEALKSLNDRGKLAGYNDECTDYKCQSCKSDYNYIKSGTGCVSDCGSGYLGKEGRCIDASLGCGAGYRQFENFCNRIQYTPAEAAEVLKDDNTNEVTITFKK